VSEEDRERIFERYVSNNSSGLGLTLCRLAAEAHGGRIWVEAREGGGSVFCVDIPQPTALLRPRS
jgi:signal transduction histidine kinase